MDLTVRATTTVDGFTSWQEAADFLAKCEKNLLSSLKIMDARISSRVRTTKDQETTIWTVETTTKMTSTLEAIVKAGIGAL
jgi:hypothetical protein